jgi:hypothetical protein
MRKTVSGEMMNNNIEGEIRINMRKKMDENIDTSIDEMSCKAKYSLYSQLICACSKSISLDFLIVMFFFISSFDVR